MRQMTISTSSILPFKFTGDFIGLSSEGPLWATPEKMRKALITGASSGIGKATAELFLLEGHQVTLVSRTKEKLEEVVKEFKKSHPEKAEFIEKNTFIVCADVSKSEDCKRLVEESVNAMKGIDILVNNAGLSSIPGHTVQTTPEEEWDYIMNTNLKSTFLITKYASLELEKSKNDPVVVNVSTVGSERAFAGLLPYCVSKAGVSQLTRCSALELIVKGIRVNEVRPGAVQSNFLDRVQLPDHVAKSYLENAALKNPTGKIAEPKHVASVIYFLASEASSHMVGQNLVVDGGKTICENMDIVKPKK